MSRIKLLVYLLAALFFLTYLMTLVIPALRLSSESTLSFVDFVHPNANHQKEGSCDDILFVGTPARGFKLNDAYTSLKPAFDDVIRWSGFVEAGEGHSARSAVQTLAIHYLASRPDVRTVCETGYNAGHSAYNYLTANPRLVVHSFDIGQYGWTLSSARNLSQMFPGRLFVHIGDSTITVPKFLSENPSVRCNLIMIDGGHNYNCAKADIKNFASVAELGHNVIIMDDMPSPHAHGPAWDQATESGFVREFVRCRLDQEKGQLSHAIGFAVGKVVARPYSINQSKST